MNEPEGVARFASVDGTDDPGHFIHILELTRSIVGIDETRALIGDGLRLADGHAVLEVGSGLGIDALEWARRVGPTGRVVGVDLSAAMVAEATRRADGLGLGVSFAVGDACRLDFPDASFDVCRTERVLLYVPDAAQAISEMVRVTRPGGRVSVFDVDFNTLLIDHPDRETTERAVRTLRDSVADGCIGRKLPRLLTEAGLAEVSVSGHTLFFPFEVVEVVFGDLLAAATQRGEFTHEQLTSWWKHLRHRQEEGILHVSLTAFVVCGTRPVVA
ncbi:MAG: methyltransferase domain-containing protein [Acidimicrobiia bacterium]